MHGTITTDVEDPVGQALAAYVSAMSNLLQVSNDASHRDEMLSNLDILISGENVYRTVWDRLMARRDAVI